MSYFHKKAKPDQSSSNFPIDQSTISNGGEEFLIVNSNIFNKSNNQSSQNPNLKSGYSQISQVKNCSPISYLKNFKKTNCKTNQQNICVDQSKVAMPTVKNNGSLKKQYEIMMNELISGQTLQESNKSSQKQTKSSARHVKSKSAIEERNTFPINQQTSNINHPFLNDQEEQSMQQLLNSSINQFQRFLEQENDNPSTSINEKNPSSNLHKTLSKFKSILKQKLQHGLVKQKQEMKNMLSEYVELITKLLHDKEEMSNHIEKLQEELGNKSNQILSLEKQVQEINHEKDEHIQKTKQQIDEFLIIIQQFENEAREETQKFEQLQREIDRLRPFEDQLKEIQMKQNTGHKKYSSQEFEDQEKRIQCQSEKIQTLLELLEKSQQETNSLKEILSKQNTELSNLRKQAMQQQKTLKTQNSKTSQGQSAYQFTQQEMQEVKAFYEQKLQELQIEHEQEFIEYEKAIKETLTKKDECIERLNFIISELRDGRKSPFKGRSSQEFRQRQIQQSKAEKYNKSRKPTYEQQLDKMSQKTFNEEQIIEE